LALHLKNWADMSPATRVEHLLKIQDRIAKAQSIAILNGTNEIAQTVLLFNTSDKAVLLKDFLKNSVKEPNKYQCLVVPIILGGVPALILLADLNHYGPRVSGQTAIETAAFLAGALGSYPVFMKCEMRQHIQFQQSLEEIKRALNYKIEEIIQQQRSIAKAVRNGGLK
jgi:hypothetical protein